MVTGSNSDTVFVEQLSHLLRGNVAQHKGDHADLFTSGSNDSQPVDHRQPFRPIMKERMLILPDIVNADLVHIIQGRPESHSIRDVGSTRFELRRRIAVGRLFKCDVANHIASALPRRQHLLHFAASVYGSNARWAEDLMPGEDKEVTADFVDVNRHMRDRLSTIDDNPGTYSTRHMRHLGHGQNRSQTV